MPEHELSFEWDPQKAASNARKRGVSFERATSVFRDPEALTLSDGPHSRDEDRWITLGVDAHATLLVVCHTWREDARGATQCRIISARKATKTEALQYRSK